MAAYPFFCSSKMFVMNEWTNKRDLLVEETLAFVQGVTTDGPETVIAAVAPAAQKNRLDMERAVIQRRVASFKANQERFQREQEEYYAVTMAKARTTQWTADTEIPGTLPFNSAI
jgi:chlorite dismutase